MGTFTDGFEDCALANWQVSGNPNLSVTCSSERKHGGTYACRYYGKGNYQDGKFIIYVFSQLAQAVRFTGYIYVEVRDYAYASCPWIGFSNAGTPFHWVCLQVWGDNNSYLRLLDDSQLTLSIGIARGSWHLIDFWIEDNKLYMTDNGFPVITAQDIKGTLNAEKFWAGISTAISGEGKWFLDDVELLWNPAPITARRFPFERMKV